MPAYYIETSALLKRYRTEPGTGFMEELFRQRRDSELLLTSFLTSPESTSVVTRLFRGNILTRVSYQKLLGDIAYDFKQHILVEPVSDAVLSEALNLIVEFGLRAPDSIQLSTALKVHSDVQDQVYHFICADSKLRLACIDSGLAVIDPENENSLQVLRSLRPES